MRRGERVGLQLFGWALCLLPGWLKERAGEEMRAVFLARHRSARGLGGTAQAWLHELVGWRSRQCARGVARSRRCPGTNRGADNGVIQWSVCCRISASPCV